MENIRMAKEVVPFQSNVFQNNIEDYLSLNIETRSDRDEFRDRVQVARKVLGLEGVPLEKMDKGQFERLCLMTYY